MKTKYKYGLQSGAVLLLVGALNNYAFGASSDTATFAVKIVISATCDIHTAAPVNVDFGTVASTATNVDQAGSITANCTPGTAYTISLDSGVNASGAQRRMIKGSGDYVAYNLYRDSARTNAWGNTSGTDTYSGTGSGNNQVIPVYGRVSSANSPAGAYADTVTATIAY